MSDIWTVSEIEILAPGTFVSNADLLNRWQIFIAIKNQSLVLSKAI